MRPSLALAVARSLSSVSGNKHFAALNVSKSFGIGKATGIKTPIITPNMIGVTPKGLNGLKC